MSSSLFVCCLCVDLIWLLFILTCYLMRLCLILNFIAVCCWWFVLGVILLFVWFGFLCLCVLCIGIVFVGCLLVWFRQLIRLFCFDCCVLIVLFWDGFFAVSYLCYLSLRVAVGYDWFVCLLLFVLLFWFDCLCVLFVGLCACVWVDFGLFCFFSLWIVFRLAIGYWLGGYVAWVLIIVLLWCISYSLGMVLFVNLIK